MTLKSKRLLNAHCRSSISSALSSHAFILGSSHRGQLSPGKHSSFFQNFPSCFLSFSHMCGVTYEKKIQGDLWPCSSSSPDPGDPFSYYSAQLGHQYQHSLQMKIRTPSYTCSDVWVSRYVFVYASVHVCPCICLFLCVHVSMCVCIGLCACVYMWVCVGLCSTSPDKEETTHQ